MKPFWKWVLGIVLVLLVAWVVYITIRLCGALDHLHDLHEWLELIWNRLGPGDPPIGPPPPPPPKLF